MSVDLQKVAETNTDNVRLVDARRPRCPDQVLCSRDAAHGVGSLVFDARSNRVANEFGRRDYVTDEAWKNTLLFRFALSKAISEQALREKRSHEVLRVWHRLCMTFAAVIWTAR